MKYPHPTAQTQFSAIHPEAQRRVVASMVHAFRRGNESYADHRSVHPLCNVSTCTHELAVMCVHMWKTERQILRYIKAEVAS